MEETISKLKSLGREVFYPKGVYIFHMGDPAASFFYLLEGEIGLYRLSREGKEVLVSKVNGEGFIAEAAAFADAPYPVSARAAKDSRLIRFTMESFRKGALSDPAHFELMASVMAEKCLHLAGRIDTLSIKSPKERIAEYLVAHCKGCSGGLIDIGMKKADLAKYFGISPEALSRNLKQLADEGLIEVVGRKIRVKDCKRLKNLI